MLRAEMDKFQEANHFYVSFARLANFRMSLKFIDAPADWVEEKWKEELSKINDLT